MKLLRQLLLMLVVAALVPATAGNLRPAPTDGRLSTLGVQSQDERLYIVQLADAPALTYRGGKGLAATKPAEGERFDPDHPNVQRYGEHLVRQHDAALRSVGAYYEKVYSYRYTFNGFAARMTEQQAQKLRTQRHVLNVWEDQARYLYTNNSSSFLGLFNNENGLRTSLGLTGENVVIGVIDSGIAPEHPSFRDTVEKNSRVPRLCRSSWAESSLLGLWLCFRFRDADDEVIFSGVPGWKGRCEAGDTSADRFSSRDCNNKIIGARFYIDGFLASNQLDANEFISPRDADGHGTHIASTAAGNEVGAAIGGNEVARISGVAPRARIAVYKACWLEPGQTRGTCSTADLQRAIEDAVADGVDIINYSVGNTDISIDDPDDLALLAASDAGVLSVVAAGNDGPDNPLGNILSPAGAPWVLTVAASSRSGKKFAEALRVDSPANLARNYAQIEATFTPPLRQTGAITKPLILVDDGIAIFGGGAAGTTYDACESIRNDDQIRDQIAFLQRTQNGCNFEEKLRNVQLAGADAAVVFSDEGPPIAMLGPRNIITIPAVMISQADGELLLDRLNAGDSIEVTLDDGLVLEQAAAGNIMAAFSSRGPNQAALDILKPDVTAPGVDILAAHTPNVANGIRGRNFQYLSGTSMAVPHVAGIAALIKQQYPNRSPAALASSLVTSARQNIQDGDAETPADPFDMGGGHVVPNKAIFPGLVYEAGKADYDAFLCGTQRPRANQTECDALRAAGLPTAAADLNLATISLGSLAHQRTIRRTVTNVGQPATYQAQITEPQGITVTVSPDSLTLGRNETAEFSLDFSKNVAGADEWRFGDLVWADGNRRVRSPIAVRPVAFVAPAELSGAGTTGNLDFDVQFGYSGEYAATVHGLAPADVEPGSVANDPLKNYFFEPDNRRLPESVARFVFDVAEDAAFLRVALFNEDTDGEDDLDLYLYFCPLDLTQPCSELLNSGADDSNESVSIEFPSPGEYYVDVHGFRTDEVAGGPGANFDLSVWTFGVNDNRGNLNITAPADANLGQTGSISLQWADLEPRRYLGGITHDDGAQALAFTVISIVP